MTLEETETAASDQIGRRIEVLINSRQAKRVCGVCDVKCSSDCSWWDRDDLASAETKPRTARVIKFRK